MDDAFPAVGLFGATFLFFTWQLGPAVSKMVHEKKVAIEQERHDTFDLIFALMDRSTDQIKASQNLPKLLEQYVVEYKAVANEASKAEVRQVACVCVCVCVCVVVVVVVVVVGCCCCSYFCLCSSCK